MTHVQLRNHPDGGSAPGVFQLLVDGVDLSRAVLAGSVTIETPVGFTECARVTMTVAADTLDVDLPASVIEALLESGAAR